jgi:hypothetical protein
LLLGQQAGERNAGGRPLHNQEQRLARWARVTMPAPSGLSPREQQMIAKLVDACRQVNSIYWRQSDYGGLELYKATRNPTLKALFSIMGSRWDLLDANRPFLGEAPMPPGREYYPHDLTRAKIEDYVRAHPEDKAAIYAPYTVVQRRNDRLIGVSYHDAYRPFVTAIAADLRAAAQLSTDSAFANFLRLRAQAVETDDYYASDLAWVDLKDPKFDLILAPYETYHDELLGVKGSYGAAVLIRNDLESRKLADYQNHVAAIQDALPVDAAARPSKRGKLAPMEVMDAPFRAGDLRYGYQAVADNLPNDRRIHRDRGSKKIFFKNFMDARVNYIVLPVAKRLLSAADAGRTTPDGYFHTVLMHEISHGLGPLVSNEALGPILSSLEEAKADVVGMFGLQWLLDKGILDKSRSREFYAS